MKDTPITIVQSDFQTLENLLNTSSNRALPGIGMLRNELNRANIVSSDEVSPDCVTMNSTVEFVDDEADKAYQMTLVYPDQAGTPGTVSVLAPVGSALLGLCVGQSLRWQVPGGRQLRLRVVAVLRQPEAERRLKSSGSLDKG